MKKNDDEINTQNFDVFGRKTALELFSEGFKNFLNRKKLSTKSVAQKLGVTDSAVSSWKYGRAFPDIPNYLRLVGLGLSPFDIMGDKLELQARINDYEMRIEKNLAIINFANRSRYSDKISQDFVDFLEKENSEFREKIDDYKMRLDNEMPVTFNPF